MPMHTEICTFNYPYNYKTIMYNGQYCIQVASLTTQLKDITISYEELKRENDGLKVEISRFQLQIKAENQQVGHFVTIDKYSCSKLFCKFSSLRSSSLVL